MSNDRSTPFLPISDPFNAASSAPRNKQIPSSKTERELELADSRESGDHAVDRRTFLAIQLLTGIGFSLSSCGRELGPTVNAGAPALTGPPPVSPDELLLFHKEDDYYDELRARFNKRVDKHPAVIALCRDTEEVSKAVRYAKQEGLKISVKSGGHSFECFSSNDGGLVIDFSPMNHPPPALVRCGVV